MLELRVLGAFEAYDAERVVELGGPRQRSVLARLAVARGQVVPVDRIVDDLWHSEPPPRAMAALQAYVSHLRRALEPDRPARAPAQVLVSAAPGYALRLPAEQVDAWHFEQLVRRGMALVDSDAGAAKPLLDSALRMPRGGAYAQFADEEWAAPEAARLDELRVIAVEHRALAALGIGMAAAAVPDLEAHVTAHPLREEAWRILALALYRSGRQSDALSALRRIRATLAEELGIDPSGALQRLEADILTHAPALDGPPPAPVTLSPVPPVATAGTADVPEPAPGPDDGFVGRRQEIDTLCTLAGESAATARGRIALVTGDPGAGKSALSEALSTRLAAEGWVVGWGRCPEGEGAPSAWPWTELLRALVQRVPPSDDVAAALAPLLADAAPVHSGDLAAARFRLHRAVGTYLCQVTATAPLLVVLDDVHRADNDSLALWTRVTEDLRGCRALIVATYRPAEVSEPLSGALATLAGSEPVRLALGGLAPDEVAALVQSTAPGATQLDDRALGLIAARTDGNPFFVREMARLLASEQSFDPAAEVPEGVRDVLRRRLARLPARSQTVLRLASVLGRDVDVDVLVQSAALAGTADEEEVLDALESGLVAGLLIESSAGAVRFSHVLIRDALYEEVSRLRRVRLHGRVAQALEQVQPANLDALAHHFTAAASTTSPTPDAVERALHYTIEAARHALGRLSHVDAVTLLERGLELSGRGQGPPTAQQAEIFMLLVPARAYGGNGVGARVARAEAIRAASAVGDADLLLRAVASWTIPTLWSIRRYAVVDDEMIGWINEALRLVPREDTPLRCRLLYSVVAELEGADLERTWRAAEQALAVARRLGDPQLLALGLNARYFVSWSQPGVDRREIGAELLELGEEHDLIEAQILGHQITTQACAAIGDMAGLRRHSGSAIRLAETYGLRGAGLVSRLSLALDRLVAGDFAAAEATYSGIVAMMRAAGVYNADAMGWLTDYVQHELRGDDLSVLHERTAALLEHYPEQVADAYIRVLLAAGREDEARALWNPDRPIRQDPLQLLMHTVRGAVAVQLGDRPGSRQAYERLLPFAGQLAGAGSGSVTLWPVDTVLGDLARLFGKEADARRHYEEALALARRAGSPHFERDVLGRLSEVTSPTSSSPELQESIRGSS